MFANETLLSSSPVETVETGAVLLKRLLDPDDLGHAVTNEVRKQAYAIISNDHEREREKWNVSN